MTEVIPVSGVKSQQISPLVAAIVIILVLLIVVGLGFYFSQRSSVPAHISPVSGTPGQPGTPPLEDTMPIPPPPGGNR